MFERTASATFLLLLVTTATAQNAAPPVVQSETLKAGTDVTLRLMAPFSPNTRNLEIKWPS